MSSHLLTFPDFTGILALSDRSRKSVSFGVSVCGILTTKVPSFHHTLVSLTFAFRDDVYKLANAEMRGTQQIPNWQEVFLSHLELSQMLFRRDSIL